MKIHIFHTAKYHYVGPTVWIWLTLDGINMSLTNYSEMITHIKQWLTNT